MKPAKLLTIIVLTAVIMVALCFYRCPVQEKAIAQESNFRVWFARHKQTINSLFYEYREYSIKCYADSTKVRMGLFYTFEGNKFKAIYDPEPGEIIGNLIEVKDEYIHREPTFLGFMDWLEEKYK